MSHHATNWAIQQRGLRPASKIVLWHLCDRHNPDLGCYPSQDRLAYDCEMSRSALNEHLKLLEQSGLIRREQQINKQTKQQENTRYRFSFEPDFVATQDVVVPCPESGHGAVSGKGVEPCPDSTESRVRIPDTNPVREPVIEPPVRADARGREDFDILWSSWPQHHRPDSRDAAWRLFSKLPGEDREKAVRGAEHYRKAMTFRAKPPRMVVYLRDRLFLDFHDNPEVDADGDFVIRPGQPEWGEWLGSIRRQHGEAGVQSSIRFKFLVRKTRWPADLSLANSVTNLAPSATGMATASAARG